MLEKCLAGDQMLGRCFIQSFFSSMQLHSFIELDISQMERVREPTQRHTSVDLVVNN